MDLSSIGLFQLASRRMEYLSARHKVIAENVSNADTPGFRARDLKPFDFQAALARSGGGVDAARTDAMHLTGTRAPRDYAEQARVPTYEMAPAGNGVVLEEQMMKAAEVRQAYDLGTGIFQKSAAMLRMAFTSR